MTERRLQVISPRRLILEVVNRWKRQYPDSRLETRAKLEALDLTTATAADIAAIIGNDSWSRLWCDGCSGYVDGPVILINPDGDGTPTICATCMSAGLALLAEVK